MTVGELLQLIGKYEFIDIEGDTSNNSPHYAGRHFNFHEDLNYEIINEMSVVGIFLLEDPDDDERRVYGFKIYYDDRGLKDAIQRYENDSYYS